MLEEAPVYESLFDPAWRSLLPFTVKESSNVGAKSDEFVSD
jgi:hypothetical protein